MGNVDIEAREEAGEPRKWLGDALDNVPRRRGSSVAISV